LITRRRAVGQWLVFVALTVLAIGGILWLGSAALTQSCACIMPPDATVSRAALAALPW
jgi:hypothetical protein